LKDINGENLEGFCMLEEFLKILKSNLIENLEEKCELNNFKLDL